MQMKALQQIESDRQDAQTKLDSLKSASERNKMGQYATPFSLAREIVEFVRDTYFAETDKIRFLDPAAGTGAFFSAMLHTFPQMQIENAVGIEFDSQIASIAKNLWTARGLDVVEADFAKLPFPNLPHVQFAPCQSPLCSTSSPRSGGKAEPSRKNQSRSRAQPERTSRTVLLFSFDSPSVVSSRWVWRLAYPL